MKQGNPPESRRPWANSAPVVRLTCSSGERRLASHLLTSLPCRSAVSPRFAAIVGGLALWNVWPGPAGLATHKARASNLRRTAIVKAVEDARPSVVNIHGQKTVRADAASRRQRALSPGERHGHRRRDRRARLHPHQLPRRRRRAEDPGHAGRRQHATSPSSSSHDPTTDLAIIKIDADSRRCRSSRSARRSDLMTGEPVIAVGNAYRLRAHGHARHRQRLAPHGASQRRRRSYEDLIQTDASINPGNSRRAAVEHRRRDDRHQRRRAGRRPGHRLCHSRRQGMTSPPS